MQKLITIIIAAVIIYAVIDAKNIIAPDKPKAHGLEQTQTPPHEHAQTTAPQAKPEPEGGFIEKSLSQVLINVIKSPEGRAFLEKVVKPANAPISNSAYTIKLNDIAILGELFRIETVSPGEGPKVSCGHIVTINYQITNSNRVIIESGQKNFRLGSHDMIPALSNIIIGMQKGEIRKGVVPKKYAYDSPLFSGKQPQQATEFYNIQVGLIDAIPNNFADESVKIFDDEVAYTIPYLCGDLAIFNAKIMRANGETIYDSKHLRKKLTISIGDNLYPMIFSHALFNKTPVGTRTVICKGKHLRALFSKETSKIFKTRALQPNIDEFFVVEFSDFKRAGEN